MNTRSKSPLVPLLVALIVVLCALVIYLIYNNSQNQEVITRQKDQIEADSATINEKIRELEELNLALNRAKMEVEELGEKSDSLQMKIIALNKLLDDVKKGNQRNIARLNAQIAEFKKLLEIKDVEIAQLREKNLSLSSRVDDLSKEKAMMDDSLTAMKSAKTELEKQVAIASMLKAENIKITALNKKDKELDKEEYKAKHIVKLKIVATLAENKVARKNEKQIMFRLIEPSGTVIFDKATGGGFFTTNEGKEIPYTDKKVIKYDNTKQTITFVYIKGTPYKSGVHKVELYAENYLIGEATFTVK
ncbi:MAG: hypothetical protein NZ529_09450 [Cytophagaceae bacterium]|nr:hypothetical protein [Cytophagaceae bacterium]MDW8457010.1 hypothetical protein [Cytophagaceae bacterium]